MASKAFKKKIVKNLLKKKIIFFYIKNFISFVLSS
jgi:hypothetical protein